MNLARADEHRRVLRTFLKADVEDSLADSERLLAEAIASGNSGAQTFYQESVDRLKAFHAQLEEQEQDAA